ncbi:MAG: Ig-like domain-containing protein [Bacteroidales bacterium]|jgi:VCBS repeat-containing protein|nr:Ig-like domain-containing protein [Bacteroidales bacterium]MDD4213856.1 Ig-like domain-containing protein [Bacteroidales bacterium]
MKKFLCGIVLLIWGISVYGFPYNIFNAHQNKLYVTSKNIIFSHLPALLAEPTASDDNCLVTEDVVFNGDVSLNDVPSLDGGNIWSIINGPLHGALVLDTTGVFTYTPDLNFFGTDSMTYKLCDIDGDCDTATVYFTVAGTNDKPVAVNDTFYVDEDNVLIDNVLTNDMDADGDTMEITGFDVNLTAYLPGDTATMSGIGEIMVDTNGGFVFTPVENWNGVVPSITYYLTDGNLQLDTANLEITVDSINDAPLTINENYITNEDTAVSGDVLANADIDIVEGTALTASTVPVSGPIHGSIVINTDGTFTYTPAPDFFGTDTVIIAICDNGLPLPPACSDDTVFIDVLPINDMPYSNDDNAYTNPNSSVTIHVLYNDTFGGDGPCACALVSTNGAHGVTSINNNGTPTNPADDKIVYTPSSTTYLGSDSFTYTIQDLDGETSTSTVFVDITPMYAPTLSAPANGAVNQMPNVLLDWTSVPMGLSYKVQISNDSLFTNPVYYSTSFSATNAVLLKFNTKYYWRVKAFSESDSSGWSDIRKFTTIQKVKIIKPTDSAKNQYVKMNFKWNAISGLANYEYEMDTTLAFSSPFYVGSLIAANKTESNSKQLGFGEHYYLRMRALHAADTSDWSDALNVWTIDTVLLKKPADDTIKKSPVCKLEWKWTGSNFYQYALSVDTLFTSPMYFTVDTLSTIYTAGTDTIIRTFTDTLLFGQKYFWKVRAYNHLDTSKWSEIRRFTTIDVVSLISPANNDTSISITPAFSWTKVGDIGAYNLEIDTSNAFSNPRYYTILDSLTSYTIPGTEPLNYFQSYYWRMRAITSLDSTDWSAPFKFTTAKNTASINDYENATITYNIYPNPSSTGQIYIQVGSSHESDIIISVINLVGQEIFSETMKMSEGNNIYTLNLSSHIDGIYFIRININGDIKTHKIIISK